MTKRLMRRVLILFGLVTLSACTFTAPQLESVVSQVRALVATNHQAEDVVWLASFNGQGAVLRPYTVEGFTVFANESGDAVAFDGWIVRSVLGFGREHALSVTDNRGVGSSAPHKMKLNAMCSEWQKLATEGGHQWRQNCGSQGRDTVIDIDGTDTIYAITQGFGDLGELKLQLRR